MQYPIYFFIIASLVRVNPLFQASKSLTNGCTEFTVGSCSPEQDELIDLYFDIPDPELCQVICNIQEGCNFFRHSNQNLECSLYHYRFLNSCNLIAGPTHPLIDECQNAASQTCDSFVREICFYSGKEVLRKESITDPHACQDLLNTVGLVYGGVYFSFDSDNQICVLYDSNKMICNAISGPKQPPMEECNNPTTTSGPVTTTTAGPNPTTTTGPSPTTTAGPKPTTTVGPSPTTTAGPEPTTTTGPKPTSTASPNPTTTAGSNPTTTTGPSPTTTTGPKPTTTAGPSPTTTNGPKPTTTAGPTPTTTAGNNPTTTSGLKPTTTTGPKPTTSSGPNPTTTAGPNPTTQAPL